MKKFLAQFPMLSPVEAVLMEAQVFDIASHMLDGYRGGQWDDLDLGGGVFATYPRGDADRVKLSNPENGCEVETDRRSAGLAMSMLAVNWTWHRVAPRLDAGGHAAFQAVTWGLQEAAYGDGSKFDQGAIFRFTD